MVWSIGKYRHSTRARLKSCWSISRCWWPTCDSTSQPLGTNCLRCVACSKSRGCVSLFLPTLVLRDKKMNEIWRNAVGYEDSYQVSSLGKIKRTVGGRGVCVAGRILKPQTKPDGHLHVRLHKNGIGTTRLIHQLVLEAFVGPCPLGVEVRHLDGNGHNNNLSNLVYGTRSENVFDSVKHGGRVNTRDSGHGQSKLSEKAIPQIREMLRDGYTQKEIAKLFGVGRTTIQKIHNGQSWKHVK